MKMRARCVGRGMVTRIRYLQETGSAKSSKSGLLDSFAAVAPDTHSKRLNQCPTSATLPYPLNSRRQRTIGVGSKHCRPRMLVKEYVRTVREAFR